MIDFLPKRDIIETIFPSLSAPASRNSGVSGAWSIYSTLLTAAANTFPFILCGAYVMESLQLVIDDVVTSAQLNIQVSIGAAGSEVPIAESHGGLLLSPCVIASGSITGLTGRTHFFEPVRIPSNVKIAYRASSSAAKLINTAVYIFGYDARYFAQPLKAAEELRYIRGLCSPTKGATVWPSPGATAVSTPAGATWVYGAAVQFIASAASPLLITGLFGSATTASNSSQAQIGIGAPGAEQWMSKVGLTVQTGFPGPLIDCYLPRPLYVKTGEAVSVRIAGNVASTATGIALKGFALR